MSHKFKQSKTSGAGNIRGLIKINRGVIFESSVKVKMTFFNFRFIQQFPNTSCNFSLNVFHFRAKLDACLWSQLLPICQPLNSTENRPTEINMKIGISIVFLLTEIRLIFSVLLIITETRFLRTLSASNQVTSIKFATVTTKCFQSVTGCHISIVKGLSDLNYYTCDEFFFATL